MIAHDTPVGTAVVNGEGTIGFVLIAPDDDGVVSVVHDAGACEGPEVFAYQVQGLDLLRPCTQPWPCPVHEDDDAWAEW